LPARAVDAVAQAVQLTQAELSRALAIPERTLVRRKKQGTLSTEESAKLLRVARVTYRAITVFEDRPAALDWLKSPNRALGGVSPLSLLDTDMGAETVLDTLGRVEHGVFA
jgi:putative toxin-antitoxin system antitoxin component (TIGR02293 family)